ncbi:hypothetical protein VTH06DRAFT_8698 [Thermothelomyces fergusii]
MTKPKSSVKRSDPDKRKEKTKASAPTD